jgi:hypothetical protein
MEGTTHETIEWLPANSPIITRPINEPLLEQLRRKNEEYRQRIVEGDNQYAHPEKLVLYAMVSGSDRAVDALIKTRLLDQVLELDQVETWRFSREVWDDDIFQAMREQQPRQLAELIGNACAVINAYCDGNMHLVTGGTGLQ